MALHDIVSGDECFINKAQSDTGFAHRFVLKDEAVPAIKDPGHDSESQAVDKTASNSCFVGNRHTSARDSLARQHRAHGTPSGALLISERIIKLYLSYINMIKLKTLWRYEGCDTSLKENNIMRLSKTVCYVPFKGVVTLHFSFHWLPFICMRTRLTGNASLCEKFCISLHS